MKRRVSILISGRGSNMQSLVEASRVPDYPAEIVSVISNRPDAAGLEWAKSRGIPALSIDHKQYATRTAFEAKLHTALLDVGTELICCAGFMRMLTGGFIDRWRDRQLNIHPSLLPAFPGLDTHQRAIDAGVRLAGCTVHFMRVEMDSGPIVAQAAVPVRSTDTADELAQRVLRAEHVIYPRALALVASGRAHVAGEKVIISEDVNEQDLIFAPGCGS